MSLSGNVAFNGHPTGATPTASIAANIALPEGTHYLRLQLAGYSFAIQPVTLA
ncbi:MAG: PEGA domain-containing protein [Zwartia sp.]